MLASFMGRGHCLVMDSAYMGDVMALIGRFVWMINMIGTVQSNRTGGGTLGKEAVKNNDIQKGAYNSLFYQHKEQPLTYAIWADNNFVKVLSNFHSPEVAVGGVKRKQRGLIERGSRIKHLSMFHCKPSTIVVLKLR